MEKELNQYEITQKVKQAEKDADPQMAVRKSPTAPKFAFWKLFKYYFFAFELNRLEMT